jgi:hypothetical protein
LIEYNQSNDLVAGSINSWQSDKEAIPMYLAEFAFPGTTELASDLLLQTPFEDAAKDFARNYASNWGMELFCLTPATEQQVRLYSLMGKAVVLEQQDV